MKVFEEFRIGGLTLENRFVRSATWIGMADDNGHVTDRMMECMKELALGGVGLIITGHAYVRKDGQASPWQLSVDSDECIPGLRDMAKLVRESGSRLCVQIAHAGANVFPRATGGAGKGPSALSGEGLPDCGELSREEIADLVTSFAEAARRVQQAGVDCVQIHGAHGYGISQFLSPFYNRRTDEYGGSIENRARFVREIVRAMRAAVGPEFPIFIKLNSEDFTEPGLSRADMRAVVNMLAEDGLDCVEMSGGTLHSPPKLRPVRPGDFSAPENQVWYQQAAREYQKECTLPLMLVGGIRDVQVADTLVADGVCDCISLSRVLVREPGIINRWKNGDLAPSNCISDNLCFRPGGAGKGVYCLTKERQEKKRLKELAAKES